jgi:hypothetical protein
MACHFLKEKKISISLRRRFQFWLLSVAFGFYQRSPASPDCISDSQPDPATASSQQPTYNIQ